MLATALEAERVKHAGIQRDWKAMAQPGIESAAVAVAERADRRQAKVRLAKQEEAFVQHWVHINAYTPLPSLPFSSPLSQASHAGDDAEGGSLASRSIAASLRSVSGGGSNVSLRKRPARLPWTVEATYRAQARREFRRSPSPSPREESPSPTFAPSPPATPMLHHRSLLSPPSARAGAVSARSGSDPSRPSTRGGDGSGGGGDGGDGWMPARPSTRGGDGSRRGALSARPSTERAGTPSFGSVSGGGSSHRGHSGGGLVPSVRLARLASTVRSRPRRQDYLKHIRALRRDLDSTVGGFYYGGAVLPQLADRSPRPSTSY